MQFIRYFAIFLGITMLGSSSAPTYAATLPELKASFTRNVKEFVACLKGDKNCDPKTVTAVRAGTALAGAVALAGTTAGIYGIYSWRKQQMQPITTSSSTVTIPTPSIVRTPEEQKQLNNDLYVALVLERNLVKAQNAFEQGANLEVRDIYTRTPFMTAAAMGNLDALKWLHSRKANIYAQTTHPNYPNLSALELAQQQLSVASDPTQQANLRAVIEYLQLIGLRQ